MSLDPRNLIGRTITDVEFVGFADEGDHGILLTLDDGSVLKVTSTFECPQEIMFVHERQAQVPSHRGLSRDVAQPG